MVASLPRSRENHAAVLFAVQLWQGAEPGGHAVRNAPSDQIYVASSAAGDGEQRFTSTARPRLPP